jgi:hypothetical protein
VRILGDPVRQFYAGVDALPWLDATHARHALLTGVGVLRAGTDGETANLDVELRNDAGQMTRLYAVPPLAAPAEIYDDDMLVFAGVVASVALESTCTIQVEA